MRAAILSLSFFVASCGAWTSQKEADAMHRGLDSVTDIVDPLYGAAVHACDATQVTLVLRDGTTEEQDRSDIAEIRDVCSRVYSAFEAVRSTQLAARNLIDAARSSEESEKLAKAIQAVASLRNAVEKATSVWGEAESTMSRLLEAKP